MNGKSDDYFQPQDSLIELSPDGQTVNMRFSRDDGTSRALSLPRHQLPQLVAQLISKVEHGQMVPIDRDSLRPGQTIAVSGFQISTKPDAIRLTLAAELPDQHRTVTIPLELSVHDIDYLMAWR